MANHWGGGLVLPDLLICKYCHRTKNIFQGLNKAPRPRVCDSATDTCTCTPLLTFTLPPSPPSLLRSSGVLSRATCLVNPSLACWSLPFLPWHYGGCRSVEMLPYLVHFLGMYVFALWLIAWSHESLLCFSVSQPPTSYQMPYISQFLILSVCWLIGGTLRIGTGFKFSFRKIKNRQYLSSAGRMPGSLAGALDRLFNPDYNSAPCGYDTRFTGDLPKAHRGDAHVWGYPGRTLALWVPLHSTWFSELPSRCGRPTHEPQKCYNCAEPLRAANGAGTTGAHGAVTSLNASRTWKHDCVWRR